jgi:type IV pilus assembly protein PilA
MKTMLQKVNASLKKNNKGFTLVELIIVIAIIAVLAAVIAPQYINYVTRSKQTTDANAMNEIAHAAEVAIVGDGTTTPTDATFEVAITGNSNTTAVYSPTTDKTLGKAVSEVVPAGYKFKSTDYQGKTFTVVVANGTADWYLTSDTSKIAFPSKTAPTNK